MALYYAGVQCELREIVLRDKPLHMLDISPKGTVPVLLLPTGQVIDESLDIMQWALSEDDPDRWLPYLHRSDIYTLIERNDGAFKAALDRYKYPNRFPDEDCSGARDKGLKILEDLNARVAANGALSGENMTLADIAIFPFIRQFANVDRDWFDALPMLPLQAWLTTHCESDLFAAVMEKYAPWVDGDLYVFLIKSDA